MSLQLLNYNSTYSAEWNEFIDKSINGSFLHKRSFYDSNASNYSDDQSLLFYKKNKIIAVMPATLNVSDEQKILNSHNRCTYGGIIIGNGVGIVESLEIVRLIVEYSVLNNVKEIIIRNPFRIFYKQISDEIDYALWYHDFFIKSREAEIYIDLIPDLEIIRKKYANGTRYNVKKALKSVIVRICENIDDFWSILIKNLEDKHAKKPVHSLSEIKLLRKNVGVENVMLFAGFQNDILIAGCLVFKLNNSLHAQYIAQDITFQEVRPVNAVLDYIIEWGKENQFKYFNLGSANEGGKVINEGLFHFKEGFGGRAVLRETMCCNPNRI